MSEKVRFTVIVPTRERADTLEACLRSVLAQDYGRLEVLVSDNAGRGPARDVAAAFRDSRVSYANTGRRVGMTQNFEFALDRVKDGWVTFLGDDDGLMPGALKKAEALIREYRVSALKSDVCVFAWPALTGRQSGRLSVPLRAGAELRGGRRWLRRVLDGRAAYAELPMLYTGGFVSLEAVNAARGPDGRFFRSQIPDVYSAVALASAPGDYLYSREPLAVNGVSQHSTGISFLRLDGDWLKAAVTGGGRLPERAAGMRPARRGPSPAARFLAEERLPFHPDLPLCADGAPPRSLQALVYECYLQSAFLRSGRPLTTRARQLALILAEAAGRDPAAADWGRAFAARHGLRLPRRIPERASLLTPAGGRGGAYSFSPEDRPVRDVAEAAQAAGRLLEYARARGGLR